MNIAEFSELVENRIKVCKEVLTNRSKQYAKDNDKLHNFKAAARIADISITKAWEGMYLKHLVSILDIVDEPDSLPLEVIEEKITDSINYLLLLEAIIKDKV